VLPPPGVSSSTRMAYGLHWMGHANCADLNRPDSLVGCQICQWKCSAMETPDSLTSPSGSQHLVARGQVARQRWHGAYTGRRGHGRFGE
jgi:hypothetical protein